MKEGAQGGLSPHHPRGWRPGSAWQAEHRPAIPLQHIWLPVPQKPAFFLPAPGTAARARPKPCGAARPGTGRCRVRVAGPQPLSLHPSWNPARLAPSSPTHCPRGEGARRLSRRCRGSGRTWRENVGSSCRGAGSCQWKWGRLQVTDRLPLRRKEAPASQRSLF